MRINFLMTPFHAIHKIKNAVEKLQESALPDTKVRPYVYGWSLIKKTIIFYILFAGSQRGQLSLPTPWSTEKASRNRVSAAYLIL